MDIFENDEQVQIADFRQCNRDTILPCILLLGHHVPFFVLTLSMWPPTRVQGNAVSPLGHQLT